MFLKTETTVVLSRNILLDTLEKFLTKDFKASFTANISFMFMWYLTSLTGQLPPVLSSLKWAPQSKFHASLYKVTLHGLFFGTYLARFPSTT